IDEIVMFGRLHKDCIGGIVRNQLERVKARLADRRIALTFDQSAIDFLGEAGYDPAFGARPVKRAVQAYVENPLAKELLGGRFAEGATIRVTAGDGGLVFA
ncbi:MAG: type VI secretion system ATPase TssH, partial [Treponemataceae bacterium]|nr:type VI secretion system ATPase TssH [Treponemataceae bacterium]